MKIYYADTIQKKIEIAMQIQAQQTSEQIKIIRARERILYITTKGVNSPIKPNNQPPKKAITILNMYMPKTECQNTSGKNR